MSTNDAEWDAWCAEFDQAQADIQTVFFQRYVFLTLNQMLDRTGSAIKFNTVVQSYLTGTYVASLSTGIRRECDGDRRSASLYRCLEKLSKGPEMADRARFDAVVDAKTEGSSATRAGVKRTFDIFAVSPQSPDLDVDKIARDMADLRDAAEAVIAYTNKVVAHRDAVAADTPAWAELDMGLNQVGRVLKRYFQLRHPGMVLGNLCPDLPPGWEEPFRHVWCPTDLHPVRAWDLDEYVHPGPGAGSSE